MHTSNILTLLCAALAIATPLNKKAIIYDVVTDVVYVTVTDGQAAPAPTESTSVNAPVVAAVAPTSSAVSVEQVQVSETEKGIVTTATPSASAAPAPESKSTSSSSSSDSSSIDPVETAALNGHNDCRPKHSAPQMTWNATLAQLAGQETSCSVFDHIMPDGADWGQNIYAAFSTAKDGFTNESAMKGATDDWYNEIDLFNAWGQASPTIVDGWLHFTQQVWVGSETVGCAVNTCGTDNGIKNGWYVWYVTCNYYPTGNVIGAFDKNVLQS